LHFIQVPLNGAKLIATGPTDTLINVFKISFVIGASIAMPLIVYQLVAFAAPGLYPHEKRALLLTLPAIFALFILGMAFAFYVMLPVAINFLQNFFGQEIEQLWTFDRYVGFVTRVVFWIGVSFEMPVVLGFLARTGIVSGPRLLGFWRHAIVIISIIAAIITPTIDPVNMAIVMGPLILLYFFSVGLAYLLYRPRAPRDISNEPFIKE
jgi:sec-independent protein translocase protein TatC